MPKHPSYLIDLLTSKNQVRNHDHPACTRLPHALFVRWLLECASHRLVDFTASATFYHSCALGRMCFRPKYRYPTKRTYQLTSIDMQVLLYLRNVHHDVGGAKQDTRRVRPHHTQVIAYAVSLEFLDVRWVELGHFRVSPELACTTCTARAQTRQAHHETVAIHSPNLLSMTR